ncbi:MAG: hypothetical protein GY835_28460, partial [bacterium]|nr:hypothetical protein [bacterium]
MSENDDHHSESGSPSAGGPCSDEDALASCEADELFECKIPLDLVSGIYAKIEFLREGPLREVIEDLNDAATLTAEKLERRFRKLQEQEARGIPAGTTSGPSPISGLLRFRWNGEWTEGGTPTAARVGSTRNGWGLMGIPANETDLGAALLERRRWETRGRAPTAKAGAVLTA